MANKLDVFHHIPDSTAMKHNMLCPWLAGCLAAAMLLMLTTVCEGGVPGGAPSDAQQQPAAGAQQQQPAPVARPGAGYEQPAPPKPSPALSFEEAISNAANKVFSDALAPSSGLTPAPTHMLLIDPLMDGLSGIQSRATQSIQAKITEIVRTKFPQFDVQPFSKNNIDKSPLVLIGTFTGVDKDGAPEGERESYRLWLTLLDLRSGKIVAKARSNARSDDVDVTPAPAFRDSPAWARDEAVRSYIDACQRSKVSDPISQEYLDQILASIKITEAIKAYEAGRYRKALDLYIDARALPAGDQFRVYEGIYRSNRKLGRRNDAVAAFGDIVEYGLRTGELAVMFLFRPGSSTFGNPEYSWEYPMWLQQIAARTLRREVCLEIVGHTSRTGPEPLNERLSLLRAEYIKRRLQFEEPALGPRMIAYGMGSRENLVGTGTDNTVDALDRRVEFKTLLCGSR